MQPKNIAILAFMLVSAAASAASDPTRIRGSIASISPGKIIVHTSSGEDVPVTLGAQTTYLQVVKSDLDQIAPGSYIGTATKSVGPSQIALEVVVFPPEMKGIGEGHFAWDRITDTTSGKSQTPSSMTNGSVTAVATHPKTNSAMTNGSVSAAADQNGIRKLTVTYKGGQQTILVPPTAPIVTFHPGTNADLFKGAAVFVQAVKNGDQAAAGVVVVEKDGVKPPM